MDYLQTDALSVGYNGKTLISKVALSVQRGRIVTLIGPNGSGKSTILKTIIGQLPSISGSVFLDGADMRSRSRGDVALRVGLLEACADDDDVPHARLCALAQARQHAAAVHGDDRMRHALRHLEDGGIARPAPERPVLRVYIEDRAAEAVGDAAAEAAADLAGLFARADDGHGRRTEQRIRDCLHTAAPPNTIL